MWSLCDVRLPAVMAKSAATSHAIRFPLGMYALTAALTLPIPSSLPPSPIPVHTHTQLILFQRGDRSH